MSNTKGWSRWHSAARGRDVGLLSWRSVLFVVLLGACDVVPDLAADDPGARRGQAATCSQLSTLEACNAEHLECAWYDCAGQCWPRESDMAQICPFGEASRCLFLPVTAPAAVGGKICGDYPTLCRVNACSGGCEPQQLPVVAGPRAWVRPGGMATGFAYGAAKAFGQNCYSAGGTLYHAGEDLFAPAGTSVLAVGPGRVVHVSGSELYYPGAVVVVEHALNACEQGRLGSGAVTLYSQYGHLGAVNVSLEQTVEGGSAIGTILAWPTDLLPGASHLHWEMRTFLDHQCLGRAGPGYAAGDPATAGWLPPTATIEQLSSP